MTKATITNQHFSPQSKGNRRFWFPSYDKTAIYNWIDHSMLVSKHSGWKSPKNVSFDENTILKCPEIQNSVQIIIL